MAHSWSILKIVIDNNRPTRIDDAVRFHWSVNLFVLGYVACRRAAVGESQSGMLKLKSRKICFVKPPETGGGWLRFSTRKTARKVDYQTRISTLIASSARVSQVIRRILKFINSYIAVGAETSRVIRAKMTSNSPLEPISVCTQFRRFRRSTLSTIPIAI